MNFDITSTLFGLSIRGEGKEYMFKTRIFSHSSKLIDENSDAIVTITRRSWWNMAFDVHALNNKYKLHQKGLNIQLVSSASNALFIDSGSGFIYNSVQVTEVKTIGLRSRQFSLVIKEQDHWLALLSASCLGLSYVSN